MEVGRLLSISSGGLFFYEYVIYIKFESYWTEINEKHSQFGQMRRDRSSNATQFDGILYLFAQQQSSVQNDKTTIVSLKGKF